MSANRPTPPAAVRNTVDFDVGGTFTDLVMTLDEQTVYRKVPTTPYDLSVGFMQVVEEAAEAFGVPMAEALRRLDTVRYSTTVAMNRLIERTGPRIGLITTEGHEDAVLIGKGAQWIDDVRAKIRTLVDRGARAFVVSLLWAFVNPSHERRVKELIREEYREYHVGYLPVTWPRRSSPAWVSMDVPIPRSSMPSSSARCRSS
jgi:N-methylhydantoinase A/oxoprolinase/acetone carboxylase beta subunit